MPQHISKDGTLTLKGCNSGASQKILWKQNVTCLAHSKKHFKTNLAENWGGGCTVGQVTFRTPKNLLNSSRFYVINLWPNFDWHTTISQSARTDKTYPTSIGPYVRGRRKFSLLAISTSFWRCFINRAHHYQVVILLLPSSFSQPLHRSLLPLRQPCPLRSHYVLIGRLFSPCRESTFNVLNPGRLKPKLI